VSAYRHTPYFDYYIDYLRPYFEQPTRFLIDLNDALTDTILSLLHNLPPQNKQNNLPHTDDWSGYTWTDNHPWQKEISILNQLFEYGSTLRFN
jgi:hypothetical protein